MKILLLAHGTRLPMTLGLCVLLSSTAIAAEKPPLTVRDSVEMTALAEPNAAWARFQSTSVRLSPDGRHFLAVTRKGNVTTGRNEFALLLYETGSVRAAVAAETAKLPAPVVLARFESTSNRPGIAHPRWLEDSRTVAFLAEGPGEVAQLYTIDIATRKPVRQTAHPTPVLDFDVRSAARRFLYAAESPLDWRERIAHGFAVGTENQTDAFGKGVHYLYSRTAYFVGTRGAAGKPVPVDIPAYKALQQWGMWLSPKGTSAITVRYVGEPTQSWWDDYAPFAGFFYVRDGNTPSVRLFAAGHPSFFLQFMRVDLATGHAEPVFDAPSGQSLLGAIDAQWIDEDRFILCNTFLPLDGVPAAEKARRSKISSIVEVDRRTGAVQRIADMPTTGEGEGARGTFLRSRLASSDRLVVELRSPGGGSREVEYRRGKDGTWAELDETATQKPPLVVDVAQSLNQPPELRATDTSSGRSRIITDLNPQFRDLELGTAETIEWNDRNGTAWSAGLLKPAGYVPGRRYPLVIQTHGYDPHGFFLDGPDGATAGYGGRAFAARGIVVLQVRDGVGKIGGREEWENQSPGYAAIIDRLDAEGLIDRNRVGIHGWSRTGFYVQHAITFSGIKFATATLSDASELSLYRSLHFFGLGYPGMVENERMIGAPFWGEANVKLWMERDPMFHLDRLRIPLRLEHYGIGVGSWWDAYVLLRRHQRPVEYVSIPDGVHSPVKPWERMTTQGEIVDWYDFWLNGHEDPDPAKAAQYARWHVLRQQQEASEKEQAAEAAR